jgi:hypothetical protein
MASWHSRVRGFFNAHKQRSVPRRTARPAVGARIVHGDVRMTVQAGMSHELWHWLLGQGWREPGHRPDRRNYRDVPSAWVTWLIDATPETRDRVLEAGVSKAVLRTRTAEAQQTSDSTAHEESRQQ